MRLIEEIEFRALRRFAVCNDGPAGGSFFEGRSKLRILLGDELLHSVAGKIVVDYGCGLGLEAVELAKAGAIVFGTDVLPALLAAARELAKREGVADRCRFAERYDGAADVVIAIDSFEHFTDPAAILRHMHSLLRPGGELWASFQPWKHPLGGHNMAVFPWAHLVLNEYALCRWRALWKTDMARSFAQTGLNQITVERFRRLAREAGFVGYVETRPIHRVPRMLVNRMTEEYLTGQVFAHLRRL